MICSRCGTQSKEGFKFCQDCGAPLEKMAIFTVPGNNSVQKKSSFSKVVLIIAVLLMLAIGGYGAIRFFSNDSSALLPIKNAQGNWGYMNKDGKIVLSPRFAFAGRFTDGFAVVGTTGATSRIDWGLDLHRKTQPDIMRVFLPDALWRIRSEFCSAGCYVA